MIETALLFAICELRSAALAGAEARSVTQMSAADGLTAE